MKVTSFTDLDKMEFDQVRVDITDALKEVGAKYGLSFRATNISYTSTNATIKLEASCLTPSGEVIFKEAEDFKKMAELYGLKPEDLGKTFEYIDGINYQIVGLKPKSRRYPILCKNLQNLKLVRLNLSFLKDSLKKSSFLQK